MAAVIFAGVRLAMLAAPDDTGSTELKWQHPHAKTLVVLAHGLTGRGRFEPLERLAAQAYPGSDGVVFSFSPSFFLNTDAYRLADTLERDIHRYSSQKSYDHIVLVGHSLGAVLLRKSLVWANGLEDDRTRFSRLGQRKWPEKTDRLVSLAGMNRGWSLEERPKEMNPVVYFVALISEKLARLSGVAPLARQIQRGSPFVADLRVQWIRSLRMNNSGVRRMPLVLHLRGDRDDVITQADSQDLAVARDTKFIAVPNTGHGELIDIVEGEQPGDTSAQQRTQLIRAAMADAVETLPIDTTVKLHEDPNITRIVYVMHGIRDYGNWADDVRGRIERAGLAGVAVVPPKYGYFPMLPFLLYWDRQKHVRQFMDEYTENLARYPNAEAFDFIGHSNGTYILGSALQHYPSIKIRNALLAGSVLPRRFPWRSMVDAGRIQRVRNVVADGDWVVAIFPAFFEQLAGFFSQRATDGLLDIGAAGFRGFEQATDATGFIRDVKFVSGAHGAAIDAAAVGRVDAIVEYAVSGDDRSLAVFKQTPTERSWLNVASNLAWAIWLILLTGVVWLGRFAYKRGPRWFAIYAIVVAGVLYTF